METANEFMVSVSGEGQILVLNPPRTRLSKEQALRFAAWLVAMSGGMEAFEPVLEAVENT